MSKGIVYFDENRNHSPIVDESFLENMKELLLPYPMYGELPLDDSIKKNVSSYLDLYKDFLRSLPFEERMEYVNRMDSACFIENVRMIYRIMGDDYSKGQMIDYLKKNPFLFEKDLNQISVNLEYIKECSYFSNDVLKYIYFDKEKSIEDRVSYIIRNQKQFPNRLIQLAVSSEEESLKNLDRNLKYIVSSYGIRSIGDLNPVVLRCFDDDLFTNKVHYDNSISNNINSRFINFSQYEKYFRGVKQDVIDSLSKISPKLVDEYNELFDYSSYCKFIENMDTYRNWDHYRDPTERACDFRDEFLTRTMFGCMFQAGTDYLASHPDEKLNNVIKLVMDGKVPLHVNEESLKWMVGSTIRDICDNQSQVLKTSGKFVSSFKGQIKNSILKSYRNASKLFFTDNPYWNIEDNDDVNRINNRMANEFIGDPYFQLGSLKKRERIVSEMNEAMRLYPTLSKKEKDVALRNMFQTVHYYMVNNEEYTIQNKNQSRDEKKDVRSLSRKIFSTSGGKYNVMDRLFYCSYNSNRLAHSTVDILRKVPIRDNFLFRNDTSSYVEEMMSNYNTLHQYGFSVDYLNEQIDFYSQKNSSIFDHLDRGEEEILFYLKKFIPLSKDSLHKVNSDNISVVVESLRDIKRMNSNDRCDILDSNRRLRDEFSIYAKEENMFFDLKRFFIEEADQRIFESVGKHVSSMTKNDKIALLESKDYFMEYQIDDKKDENDITIVVFDKKFNAPFSIHYTGNKKLDRDMIRKNQLSSHTFNHNGLTENTARKKLYVSTKYDSDSKFLSDASSGMEPLRNAVESNNIFNIDMVHYSNDNSPDVLMDKLDELDELKNLPIVIEDDLNQSTKNTEKYNSIRMDLFTRYHASRFFLLGDIYSSDDVKVVPLKQLNLFENDNKLIYKDRSVIISDTEKNYLEEMFPDKHNNSNSNSDNSGPKL